MKKLQVLWILLLLLAIGIVAHQFRQMPKSTELVATQNSAKPGSPAGSAALKSATNPTPSSEIVNVVHEEAEAVAKLTDRPEEVEEHLKDIAQHLQDKDIQVLQAEALNMQLNGDERFLSVYILGESTLPLAQESLEKIATTPIPALHESRLVNQEEILRAQAIESLRDTDRIKHVIATADDHFLADRAERNLKYREGKVSSPESQDQDALKKLLEKTTQ